MRRAAFLLVFLAILTLAACGGDGTPSAEDDSTASAVETTTAEARIPTRRQAPTLIPTPTRLLELINLDCVFTEYTQSAPAGLLGYGVEASGRVRNVSSREFTGLAVQLIVFSRQTNDRMIPILDDSGPYVGLIFPANPGTPPPSTLQWEIVQQTAVPLEPRALGPGGEANFSFPNILDRFIKSQKGDTDPEQCAVRLIECVGQQCEDVPFRKR